MHAHTGGQQGLAQSADGVQRVEVIRTNYHHRKVEAFADRLAVVLVGQVGDCWCVPYTGTGIQVDQQHIPTVAVSVKVAYSPHIQPASWRCSLGALQCREFRGLLMVDAQTVAFRGQREGQL